MYKIVFSKKLIQREPKVEFLQKMAECRNRELGTLLIKSGVGGNGSLIVEEFKQFMVQTVAFHGNNQTHYCLKIKLASA